MFSAERRETSQRLHRQESPRKASNPPITKQSGRQRPLRDTEHPGIFWASLYQVLVSYRSQQRFNSVTKRVLLPCNPHHTRQRGGEAGLFLEDRRRPGPLRHPHFHPGGFRTATNMYGGESVFAWFILGLFGYLLLDFAVEFKTLKCLE